MVNLYNHSPDSCVQSGPCAMPDCNWAALYFNAGFPLQFQAVFKITGFPSQLVSNKKGI